MGGGIEGGGVEFVGRSRDPLGVLVGGDRGRGGGGICVGRSRDPLGVLVGGVEGGGLNLCRAVKESPGSVEAGRGEGNDTVLRQTL